MKFTVILTVMCVLVLPIIDAAPPKKAIRGRRKVCQYMGKKYKDGDTFGESYDSSTNTCYISVCNSDGSVTRLDTPSCSKTTPLPTTSQPGCFHNGKVYNFGETISNGSSGNWCFGSYCDKSGHVIAWDDFNCGTQTTSPPPTTPPPSTTPKGCYYDGKFYQPGTEISKGEDKASNWCYGAVCSESGEVLQWDNFNCFSTPTTKPPTTMEPTTPVARRNAVKSLLSKLLDLLRKRFFS